MTGNSLIDLALKEIAVEYRPGILAWTKANSWEEWGKMLALEEEINKTALCSDLNALRGVLDSYRGIILAMVKGFKSLKEKKGQAIFNFVEHPSPRTGERWVK